MGVFLNSRSKGLFEIHSAVLLFGVAGLFGKFLEVSPVIIVFGRTLFAWIALLVLLLILKEGLRVSSMRDLLGFLALGVVLAVHWLTFFHAIQISTVAIGLLTYSTFPVFVTFIEPVLFKHRLTPFDILMALIVFAGLLLVIPEYDLSNNLTQGVLWGTLSGFTFALLSVLNRKYVMRYSAMIVAFYQDLFACALLLPFVLAIRPAIGANDLLLLVFLGVVCTAVAHTLFIKGMLNVRAQVASIIASLEPVYGIVLAILLLREFPTFRIVSGGFVIVAATVFATMRSRNQGRDGPFD
jgi:drug/metabolite transporter (DMT)-like permease